MSPAQYSWAVRATSKWDDFVRALHGHAADRARRLFAAAREAEALVAARNEHAAGRVLVEADRALVPRGGLGIRSIGARWRRRGRGHCRGRDDARPAYLRSDFN